jgi:phosphoribosylamine--glycine ligase
MTDTLVVGKSNPIVEALARSPKRRRLYVISDHANPGLKNMADDVMVGMTKDPKVVVDYAKQVKPDFAVIGSEEPLEQGVADALEAIGIPCVGPKKRTAALEYSKAFTRELLSKYGIPGNPKYQIFRNFDNLEEYLRTLDTYVIKPDGLTGGKGVKVFGEHFSTLAQATAYCKELFEVGHKAVIIEERLDGEEFSFQSFFDGKHIAHTIPVQDHKRALDDDKGANTGGMGSYSCADHLLPFLTREDVAEAENINRLVGEALLKETGQEYKGILYGGFMITRDGLRVIEYNSRFGDPEVMNVLPLLENDFVDVCQAIIDGTLDRLNIQFRRQATVCKYLVPRGYPDKSAMTNGGSIDVSAVGQSPELGNKLRMYYAAVDEDQGKITLSDSRSLAFVGIADTLFEAERIAEAAASSVKGPVFHRRDIGTSQLIQKRVDHVNQLMGREKRRRATA